MAIDPTRRTRRVVQVLSVTLALNLVAAFAKLFYGWRSSAIAIQADGLHSLLDGASNVIALIGVQVARRPPDANHPYGHRKYETFAALGIAVMMFAGCWEIGAGALERLRHPQLPRITPAGFLVMIAAIAVNSFVTWFERRMGRTLGSEVLQADAAHTRSDLFASLLVLASFALTRLGMVWVDVVSAGLVVLLVLRAGVQVLGGTLSTLSDERRVLPELVEGEALGEPGVLEVHNVRSRGALDDVHVDLHVLVDPGMPIAEAHAIGHRVEERLRRRWRSVTDVVVHVEPALESERARVREGGGLRADG